MTKKDKGARWEMRWIIANCMKRRRRERGASAESVALELDMPPYAIHNIENCMAWVPQRVESYLEWLGCGRHYFALESLFAENEPPPVKAP